jgi:hypothetical protein
MDDGDKQNKRKILGKRPEVDAIQRHEFVPSTIFQSLWIRCRSILPNITDGKFMESELRYVLYCGIIFWMLHLLWQIIK